MDKWSSWLIIRTDTEILTCNSYFYFLLQTLCCILQLKPKLKLKEDIQFTVIYYKLYLEKSLW